MYLRTIFQNSKNQEVGVFVKEKLLLSRKKND